MRAEQLDVALALIESGIEPDLLTVPSGVTIDLGELTRSYLLALIEQGIADPLDAPLTLAAVVADLFGMAGAPLPPAVARRIGEEDSR